MAPAVELISETWMMRMFEMLQAHISLVVCEENISQGWKGFDTFSINRRDIPSRVGRRLFGRSPALMLLRSAIKRRKINKIFINYASMAITTRAAWEDLDVEVFVHCHGHDIHFDAKSEEWPHSNVNSASYLAEVQQLSGRVIYIANSEYTRQHLIQYGIAESRIRLKLFGVEDQGNTTLADRKPNRRLKLLFLGRLVDFKGPDLVIKAFDLACKKGLQADLIIAGDGHLLNTCELLQHDSPYKNRITIHGPVDRESAAKLYLDADLFVGHHRRGPISNREEAFGVTMIEAMSYGLPIVTGRSGGVKESVIHGVTGFLVEPGDIDAYVEYLLQLASNADLRAKMGASGINHVRQNFSLAQERQCLINLLEL
jgi:glycosyltransferase involved in cell wall biosynthesis